MQAATDRRSHDDDRVPLDALIELAHADGGEVLEADAVDVSSGGLSLRASFMPPMGARMQCRFSVPPHGDRVVADCEVVWSVLEGPHAGAFGVRFLALDTRSATLIRRLLEPDNAHVREVLTETERRPAPPPGKSVVASLHIDGLGAPIEADVQLDEGDHVLVTQELSFLRLGRGVRVEIEGVEQRRGRIASVKLEQVRSDTPALALGVLIDAAETPPDGAGSVPGPEPEPEHSGLTALPAAETPRANGSVQMRSATDTWPESPLFEGDPPSDRPQAPAAAPEAEEAPRQEGAEPEPQQALVEAPAPQPAAARAAVAPRLAAPQGVAPVHVDPVEQATEAVESEVELPLRAGLALPSVESLRALLSSGGVVRLRSLLSTLLAQGRAWVGAKAPELRTWLEELWARARQWGQSQTKKVQHFRRAQKKRRTTAPAPRPSNVEARRKQSAPAARPRASGRGRLVLVGLLAFAGVAGAIYSLAPRRSDDALVLHRPVEQAEPSVAEPTVASSAPAVTKPAQAAPAADEPAEEAEVPDAADGLSFGAAEVPNGRTYSLRMSGPIESIEGEQLRGGFAVRLPGLLSLDRASPIATSHPALSRSLILNQGDRAELTIEFAPGKKPAYRVEAKGNNLEITVERL